MTEAEKDLLNGLCDVVVSILTKHQGAMFEDGNNNVASGWDLAKILLACKHAANDQQET